jgi:hypothetical protein
MNTLMKWAKVIEDQGKATQRDDKTMANTQTNAKPTRKPVMARGGPIKGKGEVAAALVGQGSIVVKKSACSLDLGPSIVSQWATDERRKSEITSELNLITGTKRRDLITQLTLGIVKAAKGDDTIDLSLAFSGDPKQQGKLNNLLGIALGFRTVVTSAPDKTGVSYDTVVSAPAVKEFFPMPGETEANTTDYRQKLNFSKNFLAQLKKCAGAAQAIIDQDVEAHYDKKLGTMVISGPAVKKRFGQESVVINEAKSIGEGNAKVELNEKPSFQALAVWGGETVGADNKASAAGTPGSRGTKPGTIAGGQVKAAEEKLKTTKPDAAVVSVCKILVSAIEKYEGEITEEMEIAFSSVTNAIDVALGEGNAE